MSDDAVWAEDDDFSRSAYTRYSWEEAARLTTERPGKWLLVSDDAPPSTVSNVNGRLIKTLTDLEEEGWVFTARATDIRTPDADKPYRRRGKVWLKAEVNGM